MNFPDRYPVLAQVIGAYFSQDYLDDYGTPEGAIDAVLRDLGEDSRLVREIAHLRTLALSEEVLEEMFADMGAEYVPVDFHSSWADWLATLHQRLEARTDGRG